MRCAQRTSQLVGVCSICGPCFVGKIQKESLSMSLLHKTKEKAQNISSKLHKLNTTHVLRDWRHVTYIFADYFQLATIGLEFLDY